MSDDYSDLEDDLPTATTDDASPQRKRQKLFDSNPNTPDTTDKPITTTTTSTDDTHDDDTLRHSQPVVDDDSIVVTAQRIPIVIDLTAVQGEQRTKHQQLANSNGHAADTDSNKENSQAHTLPDTTMHLLPCMIDHNGSANISTYFLPTITPVANTYVPASSNSKAHTAGAAPTHYKSTFRGRGMVGECMQLKGQVVVLQENTKDSDRIIADVATEGHNADAQRLTASNDGKLRWSAVEATDRLWMWCRDDERHERDTLKRALTEWPALANALHAPIPI